MAVARQQRSSRVRLALASRCNDLPVASENPFFSLLKLAEKRRDVITLGRGDPDISTPKHIVDAAKRALDDGQTTYTDPAGLRALREEIARKLERDNGLVYDPEQEIVVTTGAQEALAVIMQTLLNPGDEVLVATPYYTAYESNVILAHGTLVGVPTTLKHDFQLLAADVEARITDRTKLLALVSPSNPTAAGLVTETLEGLAEVARANDLVVLSDELYEKVVYEPFEHVSIACLDGMRERTIVVNGFSKAYSMTGFRVGYFAAPADYVQAALETRRSLTISAPTPSQYAALAALTGPQEHLPEMVAEYTRRRNTMAVVLDQLGVKYSLPRGAFFFWANISDSGLSSYEFCQRAVSKYGILFFPGTMFGESGEGYIRMSFLAPPDRLERGLERFSDLYHDCINAR
jgi:aminotransferase